MFLIAVVELFADLDSAPQQCTRVAGEVADDGQSLVYCLMICLLY